MGNRLGIDILARKALGVGDCRRVQLTLANAL